MPDDWTTTRFLLGMTGDMGGEENRLIGRPASCRSFDAIATGAGATRMVRETVFHTLQSFSRVRLEFHPWLQYDDGEGGHHFPDRGGSHLPRLPHGELIRVYNQGMDTDVLKQVPVDVLAALFGYPIKGLPRLYRVLDGSVQPGDITYNIGLLVATEGHDPTLLACLRKYATHAAPRVRDRVGRYAKTVGHPELTREILAAERDEGVREALRNLLGE